MAKQAPITTTQLRKTLQNLSQKELAELLNVIASSYS